MTLLSYLRSIGLTGTKLGCGEGGCGACTVMVSHFDSSTQRVSHQAVNACLAPLCSCDMRAITTIEGIGGMRAGLHPVQARVAALNGSQCGFCTPGIVMALYTLLRNNPNASTSFVEENMDGNLCRCTGYRPILDAAKSLCCGGGGGASGSCCGGSGGGGGGGCCGGGGKEVHSTTEDKLEEAAAEGLVLNETAEPIFPPELQLMEPTRAVGAKSPAL